MNRTRSCRPSTFPLFTVLGAVLAAGALIAITAMGARAAVPPNLNKAIDAQKRLTTQQPNDAAAFNDLGNLLVLAHQSTDAEAAYRRAVELDPRRTSALFNLGLLEQQSGNSRDAKQLYEKVVEIEPQHAWAHYQLGTIYERSSAKSRAIREYSQAFALDPQLAFREVNPQVVENRLVTESLLRAYQRQSAAGEAQPIYDEPSRIRDLLLAPREADTANAQADPTQHPAVLRQKDLPTGNVGQATPPGTKGGAAPAPQGRPAMPGVGVPGGYAGAGVPNARQWSRPNPITTVPNSNLDATPGTVMTPPPTGLYYRPGLPSTGRLETQVVPQENG